VNENVSIVVAILFFNRLAQTVKCIRSFLTSDIEIVVLNNGSCQSDFNEMTREFSSYKQVRFLESEKNIGVACGRNRLVAETSQDWIYFVDNDIHNDTLNWHDRMLEAIKASPSASVIVPRVFNVHEQKWMALLNLAIDHNRYLRYTELVAGENIGNVFPGGAACMSRQVFVDLGLYEPQIFVGFEDSELAIRAIKLGRPLCVKHIDTIALVHDHQRVSQPNDINSVRVRYDLKSIESSRRIVEQKHNVLMNADFQDWVNGQLAIMLNNELFISDIEHARKLETSLKIISEPRDAVILRSTLIRYYSQKNHVDDLTRLIADLNQLVAEDFQHILSVLVSSNRKKEVEQLVESIDPLVKERWDVRLQLARFAISCGNFDSSLAISKALLLEKKDNPSASGLLILSLTRLGRYSELFEYIEFASDRALSPDWAVLALVHEYESSSKIDPSRMLRVIEKIALSRTEASKLWSIRLKRMAGFIDEAYQELMDLGSPESLSIDYKVELAHTVSLSDSWHEGVHFYRELAFDATGISSKDRDYFRVWYDRATVLARHYRSSYFVHADYKFPDSIFEVIYRTTSNSLYSPQIGRIALINGTMGGGGAEKRMLDFYQTFKEDCRYSPEVWLYSVSTDLGHDAVLVGAGISDRVGSAIYKLPDVASVKMPFNLLPTQIGIRAQRVYEYILERRPEVVHAWEDSVNLEVAFAALYAGVSKIVLHPHNMRADKVHNTRYVTSFRRAYQELLKRSEVQLVCVSDACLSDYVDWLEIEGGKRNRAIKNGFKWQAFPSEQEILKYRNELREKLNLNVRAKLVGGIFRVTALKRPQFWLDVAAEHLKLDQDVRYVLFGVGDELDSAKAYAEVLGISDRVMFPGFVHTLSTDIFGLDAVLHTSETEGLPSVVIEAQAAGVPVVSTDVGGVRECVIESHAKLLSIEHSAEQFAYSLHEFSVSPIKYPTRVQIAEAIRERFKVDEMVRKFIEVYDAPVDTPFFIEAPSSGATI
jgi:glycosyltransferase involved in cell wall biosynthesis/GT2 family glycosyltransferase